MSPKSSSRTPRGGDLLGAPPRAPPTARAYKIPSREGQRAARRSRRCTSTRADVTGNGVYHISKEMYGVTAAGMTAQALRQHRLARASRRTSRDAAAAERAGAYSRRLRAAPRRRGRLAAEHLRRLRASSGTDGDLRRRVGSREEATCSAAGMSSKEMFEAWYHPRSEAQARWGGEAEETIYGMRERERELQSLKERERERERERRCTRRPTCRTAWSSWRMKRDHRTT